MHMYTACGFRVKVKRVSTAVHVVVVLVGCRELIYTMTAAYYDITLLRDFGETAGYAACAERGRKYAVRDNRYSSGLSI